MKANILTALFKFVLWLSGAKKLKIDWKKCDSCKTWVHPCGDCQVKLDALLENYQTNGRKSGKNVQDK